MALAINFYSKWLAHKNKSEVDFSSQYINGTTVVSFHDRGAFIINDTKFTLEAESNKQLFGVQTLILRLKYAT